MTQLLHRVPKVPWKWRCQCEGCTRFVCEVLWQLLGSTVLFLTQGGKDKDSCFRVAQKKLRSIFQELLWRLLMFQTLSTLANSSVAHWPLLHFKRMDSGLVLWNSVLFLSVAFPGDADDDKIVGCCSCPEHSVPYQCPWMLGIISVVVHSPTTSGSCQLLTARNLSMDWVVYLDSSQILQSHQIWNMTPTKRRESKVAAHGVSETKGETLPSVSLHYMIFLIYLHSRHPFLCILTWLSVHICIPPDFLHGSFLS